MVGVRKRLNPVYIVVYAAWYRLNISSLETTSTFVDLELELVTEQKGGILRKRKMRIKYGPQKRHIDDDGR